MHAVGAATQANDRLGADQRRLLVGICAVAGVTAVVPATYNFVLNPMLDGLGATESQQSLLRQLPSIASLLMVFIAGALGSRVGERKLLLSSFAVFTAGSAIVAIAPVLGIATLGLVLLNAATSVMAVVSLGLLSSRVDNPKARATAFSTLAIIGPLAYMAFPVIAGVMLDAGPWRLVPLLWMVTGVVLMFVAAHLLPKDHMLRAPSELVSPVLAGLVLTAGVQTITAINHSGLLSSATLIRAAVTVVSAIALVWYFRRTTQPSLSLAALRGGGMLVLLAVVIVVPFVNLWFYMTVGYQYVFGMSALQTAVLLIPSQCAGVIGALISRKLLQRWGITSTGVTMLIALAASLLTSLTIKVDSPTWLLVLVMSLYAAASIAAAIPVTNSIMDTAPPGEEGGAAAFRAAATNIGHALGVIVMTTIVYTVVANNLSTTLGEQGLKSQQSAQIAESMRDGSTSEDVSANYAVPIGQVGEIDTAQKSAMVDGLHAHGLWGAGFIGFAAALFWLARRRANQSSTE